MRCLGDHFAPGPLLGVRHGRHRHRAELLRAGYEAFQAPEERYGYAGVLVEWISTIDSGLILVRAVGVGHGGGGVSD